MVDVRRIVGYAVRQFLLRRTLTLVVFILVIGTIFTIAYPGVFLGFYNISSMLLNMSTGLMVVIGQTVNLIGGEVDLSVGWNMGLSGVIYALLMSKAHLPLVAALPITLAIGGLCGLLVGIIVAYMRVNSFIATLGAGLIYYGIEFYIAGGISVTHLESNIIAIGTVDILGLQAPIWYAAILTALFLYLMGRTRVFKQYPYIGFNREAARLSGIRVAPMKILAFVISAVLSSFAGIVSAAEYATAMLLVGQNTALNSVTAAMVGGVSFTGGIGTMTGAVLGQFFIGLINNIIVMGNVNAFWQPIIIGLILLLVVIVDATLSRVGFVALPTSRGSTGNKVASGSVRAREGGGAEKTGQ